MRGGAALGSKLDGVGGQQALLRSSMHHRATVHNGVALAAVQCMYCLSVKMHPPACLPLQVGIVSFGTDLPETASEEEVLKVRPLCCCCCH